MIFFWFFLFESFITSINLIPLYCKSNHFDIFWRQKKWVRIFVNFVINFNYFFQSASSYLLTLTFHCLVCERLICERSKVKHHLVKLSSLLEGLWSPKLDRYNSWERSPGGTPPQELVKSSQWGHVTLKNTCSFAHMSVWVFEI